MRCPRKRPFRECFISAAQAPRSRCPRARAQVAPTHTAALTQQYAPEHASTHEGMLPVKSVASAHERYVGIAGGPWPALSRASADIEQLGLTHHAKWMFTVEHRFALSTPALVSATSKSSPSSASCLILACSGARSTGSGAVPMLNASAARSSSCRFHWLTCVCGLQTPCTTRPWSCPRAAPPTPPWPWRQGDGSGGSAALMTSP